MSESIEVRSARRMLPNIMARQPGLRLPYGDKRRGDGHVVIVDGQEPHWRYFFIYEYSHGVLRINDSLTPPSHLARVYHLGKAEVGHLEISFLPEQCALVLSWLGNVLVHGALPAAQIPWLKGHWREGGDRIAGYWWTTAAGEVYRKHCRQRDERIASWKARKAERLQQEAK